MEDDPDRVTLTRHALAGGHAEVQVDLDVVETAEQALDRLLRDDREGLPDLVLLDLKLAGDSGFDVLERVRDDPHAQAVPIVVLTSSREREDRRMSYRLGANSYVTKPVDYDQFRERIHTIRDYWLSVNEAPHPD